MAPTGDVLNDVPNIAQQPLVSVVIPTFNRAAATMGAIQSVLAQTFREFEVVVVDDGSTDDVVREVTSFCDMSPHVRLIRHERNRGAQAARNAGARAARGRWLAFLDSDDTFVARSLELRLDAARAEGVEVVHSECHVLRDGATMALFGVPAVHGWIYRDLLKRQGPMFQGLLVSAGAFARIGGLDEQIVAYQEWDTSIRLAREYAFGFVSEPTFVYDCRGRDRISENAVQSAEGFRQVFRKHFGAMLVHAGPKAISGHYRALASHYADAGSARQAARSARAAFAWWPRPAQAVRKMRTALGLSV